MTPNSFLDKHVNYLAECQIQYAFLRNSRGYPETLTGDVDLLIKKSDLKKIYQYYKGLNCDDIRVVQIIPKRRDLYVMLFFPRGGKRKYLVFEYFTGIVFRGSVIVEGERLLHDCEIDGPWRRLTERVSISYTFMHYVIYKGYLPSKYQGLFDIHGLDQTIAEDVLAFIDSNMPPSEAKRLLENPKKLHDQVRRQGSRIKTFTRYAVEIARLRPESFGCVLKVNPADAQAVIEFADKYHLCRPTHRYLLMGNPVFSTLSACIIVWLGGLAVLPRAAVTRPSSVAKYFDQKFGEPQ